MHMYKNEKVNCTLVKTKSKQLIFNEANGRESNNINLLITLLNIKIFIQNV